MITKNKEYTISNTSGHCSEEHSRRSYIPFSADKVLTDCNVIIYDCGNDRQHLNDMARPYIQEYNNRQKRNDRKKDYEDDYVAALEDGRACFGKGDKKEKPFHHDVIQIGNREDFGITDKDFDVRYWRKLKKTGKSDAASKYVLEHRNTDRKVNEAIQILCEIAEEIRDNKDNMYSNILVHGLTVHCDEPNGSPHLDFRYTIFTDNERTGVPWRVSDHKGLAKMGFTTESKLIDGQDEPEMFTALQKFRESINSRIEEKMAEHGWGRKYLNEHRKHLSTAQYEAERTLLDAEREAKRLICEAEDIYSDYMDEVEVERRKLKSDRDELASVRKNLSDFLESEIGIEAYRRYMEACKVIHDDETIRRRKRNGKIQATLYSPDLPNTLRRIDSMLENKATDNYFSEDNLPEQETNDYDK